MLDKNYICENCGKKKCKQLEWSKVLKMWLCYFCAEEEYQNDKK